MKTFTILIAAILSMSMAFAASITVNTPEEKNWYATSTPTLNATYTGFTGTVTFKVWNGSTNSTIYNGTANSTIRFYDGYRTAVFSASNGSTTVSTTKHFYVDTSAPTITRAWLMVKGSSVALFGLRSNEATKVTITYAKVGSAAKTKSTTNYVAGRSIPIGGLTKSSAYYWNVTFTNQAGLNVNQTGMNFTTARW